MYAPSMSAAARAASGGLASKSSSISGSKIGSPSVSLATVRVRGARPVMAAAADFASSRELAFYDKARLSAKLEPSSLSSSSGGTSRGRGSARSARTERQGRRRSSSATRSVAALSPPPPQNARAPRRRRVGSLAGNRTSSSSRRGVVAAQGVASVAAPMGSQKGERRAKLGGGNEPSVVGELLTREEVGRLSARFQEMLRLYSVRDMLQEQLGAGREPTDAEWAAATGLSEDTLSGRVWQGKQAQESLVGSNVRLVMKVAHMYRTGHGLSLDDLIQEGCMGLIIGVEKFDPSQGYALSTYVYHWIRMRIQRSIANSGRSIRLPCHIGNLQSKVKRVTSELFLALGRMPTDGEVARMLDVKPSRVRELRSWSQALSSLEDAAGGSGGKSGAAEGRQQLVGDGLVGEDAEGLYENADMQLLRIDVEDMLDTLSPSEGRILRLRFGLDDGKAKTLAEVAAQVGVTAESVRKGQNRGLRNLRHPERAEVLLPHIEGEL